MFLNLLFGIGWLWYMCFFCCRYLKHSLNVCHGKKLCVWVCLPEFHNVTLSMTDSFVHIHGLRTFTCRLLIIFPAIPAHVCLMNKIGTFHSKVTCPILIDWKLWGTYGHLLNQHMGWEYLLQSWPRLPLCDLWSQDAVFALINVSLELRFVEKQRHWWNPYIQKHIPAPAAFHVYNTSPSHVRVNSSANFGPQYS